MANIFLQLSSQFKFSKEALERITSAKNNDSVTNIIDHFYDEEE